MKAIPFRIGAEIRSADMGVPDRSIEFVQRAVCKAFEIARLDMLSARRTEPLTTYRHIAMWLARKTTAKSLPEIGWAFRRDHTTVMSAIWRIDEMMARTPEFAAAMNGMRDRLRGEV